MHLIEVEVLKRRLHPQVYEQYGRDIMSAVTAGQDATVLVLGRPSTGKSHTVFGQAVTSLSGRSMGCGRK